MNHGVRHLSFAGERLQQCELPGFVFAETIYPAGLTMPRHTHEPAYVTLVLQGGYTEQYGQKIRDCAPATLVFHPPGEDHAIEFHQALVRIFRIEVKPYWLERVREHSTVLDEQVSFAGGAPSRLAVRLYHESRTRDAFAPLAAEGLMLEMLATASRQREAGAGSQLPDWLLRARDLLHDRFAENLTLAEIAETSRVHPVYLAREFRKRFHCTVGEYVRRLRVENACRQMAGTDAPLADIAVATGFYDQSHFSRTFKQITGKTPAEFRAAFRRG